MKFISSVLVFLLMACWATDSMWAQQSVYAPFSKREVTLSDSEELRIIALQTGAESYRWSDGSRTPSISITQGGWYWVDVMRDTTVTRDSIHIRSGPPCFNLPNGLSPNAGIHDCISLRSDCMLDSIRFIVYDRLGETVFETTDMNDCWDGHRDGQLLPGDVYVYILQWAANGHPMRKRSGTITLIR